MFDIVISGKCVDPINGVFDAFVGVRNGKIERLSDKGIDGKIYVQLTSSQLLFPGFIDPHVHLREPGWEHKEDFETGSKAAIHGGVTAVGDMPNLPEPIINKERLLKKMALAKKSLIDIVHFGGVGKELGEINNLAPLVPAFKIYTAKSTGELTLGSWNNIEEAARIISKLGKPITFHCEEQPIIDKDPSRPREAEIVAVKKVIALCRKHGIKANIAHISVKESAEIVNENMGQMQLTCEVTPHHMFFTKNDVKNSLLKMNPPLREKKDCEALIKSVRDGSCMLATDHAPHTIAEKNSSNPAGVPGLDTYGNFVLWLMVEKKASPETLSKVTSLNAARYLSLNDRARIKEGSAADLVILDKKGSTDIRNTDMKTKCGWSPFDGITFPGRISAVVRKGVFC